ncbi:MAG: hypothetical protein ACOCXG_05035 [Nanoarchaeota archaeon]
MVVNLLRRISGVNQKEVTQDETDLHISAKDRILPDLKKQLYGIFVFLIIFISFLEILSVI